MNFDIQQIPISDSQQSALTLLLRRELDFPDLADERSRAQRLAVELFGQSNASFSQILAVDSTSLASAVSVVGGSTSAAQLQATLASLQGLIPTLPVCSDCGEFAVVTSSGATSILDTPGLSCPFCKDGLLELVPWRVRKLAWTHGNLVPVTQTHDFSSQPGEKIPLDDIEILLWLGDFLHPDLEDALRQNQGTVHGVLAFLRHRAHVFDDFSEASDVLRRPQEYGFDDAAAIHRMVRQATRYADRSEDSGWIGPKSVDTRRVIRVDEKSYRVVNMIAKGAHSKVFLAEWEHALVRRVLIKTAETEENQRFLEHEFAVLKTLQRSTTKGSDHFLRFVPLGVARSPLGVGVNESECAFVYEWRSGFQVTLVDAMDVHRARVPVRPAVWIWKRVLEMLGWLHDMGQFHGEVTPPHVLIHPQKHGATLVGWCNANRLDSERELEPAWSHLNQPGVPPKTRDLSMLARCIWLATGGDTDFQVAPTSTTPELNALLRKCLHPSGTLEAWQVREELIEASLSLGPSGHFPLEMPGW